MGVDVCYIVSHGFASRMILQTGLVDRLLDQGLSVAIISNDANDPNFDEYKGRIETVEWTSKSSIWDDDYLHKRMYYLEDIHGNPALLEKFFNGLFFSNSRHPWKRVRPLYYYFFFLLVKIFPSIRMSFLEKESRHLKSEEATSIVSKVKPRLLISTYPVSIMEAKLLHAAKSAKVPTLLHLLSWDNISCKGRFPVLPEKYIAWGPIMKEELQAYYDVNPDNIAMCGVPHFDEHVSLRDTSTKDAFIKDLGLDPQRPYLFLAMSSPRFAPNEIDIVEWLASSIENDDFGVDLQLIVRPHPQNITTHMAKESWIGRLEKLKTKRVAVDFPDLNESQIRWSMKKNDMTRLSALLSGCLVCLNSGSTVSIDALMHLKPVIFTSFDGGEKRMYWNSARRLVDYNHLNKFVKEGGAWVTRNYEELCGALETYLNDPDCEIEKRRSVLLRECFEDDGKSTERVVEQIVSTVRATV